MSASTVNDLINFEMQLHIDLCDEYGISKTDLERTDEQNENIAYTRYVLELGYSGDFLDLLSALSEHFPSNNKLEYQNNLSAFIERIAYKAPKDINISLVNLSKQIKKLQSIDERIINQSTKKILKSKLKLVKK